ncbi:MAG: MFS transporter [Bacteroidia bacterium]|nr:MFS transporter [Bacteroidia bacterium]
MATLRACLPYRRCCFAQWPVLPWIPWGAKPTYMAGLFFFIAITPLHAWAGTLSVLLILRFFHGMAWGVVTTGGSTLVADIVPPLRRGEGIGYFGMSFTAAMALGPVLGLSLMHKISYEWLFYLTTVIVLFTFVLANFIHYPQLPFSAGGVNVFPGTRFMKPGLYPWP